MNKFISTAIYYSNSKLHIGSSYEMIFADAIARYSRMNDENVFFMTGMDEHGQKIAEKAKELNVKPQEHVDKFANEAKDLLQLLKVSNDYFIRTTDDAHKKSVQNIFQKLLDSGDIYLSEYKGNYCVACESFITDSQLDNNKCPDCGRDVEVVSEESYFLNLKKYEKQLVDHISDNPNFIVPETKKNEILSFLSNGLEDLSVTRTSFDWGIPILNDPKHVVYVWIDALSNYISALNYPNGDLYNQYWSNGEIIHIIGKDILRFHAIYWPIVLMALKEKLPTSIVVHGFIMMGNDKMSKSKGNVAYAEDYVSKYGVDPLRYYLLTELANGNDGSITFEQFIERYNYDLVNDLSNLVNRTASMCKKYFDSPIKYCETIQCDYEDSLVATLDEIIEEFHLAMSKFDTRKALQSIWKFVSRTNKFVDETEPWKLAKEDKEKLMNVLYILVESLRNISILIKPFIDDTACKIDEQFNFTDENKFCNLGYNFNQDFTVNKPKIIYSRVNIEEELEKMSEVNENVKELIKYEDFEKLDLKVAHIVDCVQHPNADKLLLFKLKVGDEERQICSGIAERYAPEELIGKNVVIVANLKPVKLRGEISEGMILSAELGEELHVLETIAKSGSTVL